MISTDEGNEGREGKEKRGLCVGGRGRVGVRAIVDGRGVDGDGMMCCPAGSCG